MYNPQQVSYDQLLDVFFKNTGANSQGIKVQYKDAIWTHSKKQQEIAAARAAEKGVENRLDIEDSKPFYDAEQYHQKFYKKGR
mmetsp:Transcript_153449/g.267472  ORF Transcript_153449/g.267472 Transcript_153449/m.267472 type:complete len:83 (+) Transcript_153449:458-706(+)